MSNSTLDNRLLAIDLARCLAFFGMVVVNFDLVMVILSQTNTPSLGLASVLQGRAAATFVVLAGVGLGLSSAGKRWRPFAILTLKRAAFLFVVGLLNMLVFDADIIHYYAVYFVFMLCFVRASAIVIWFAMVALTFAFVVLVSVFDYEQGWIWETFNYTDLMTVQGFARHLFFNGWHPVVPWLALCLFGLYLSRLNLRDLRVQRRLLVVGLAGFVAVIALSRLLALALEPDGDAVYLVSSAMMPPMPLYIVSGCCVACLVLGLCFQICARLESSRALRWLTAAGRQTLTLYLAHILLGMGFIEYSGVFAGRSANASLWVSAAFCAGSVVYASLWQARFKRGPVEALMRRVST